MRFAIQVTFLLIALPLELMIIGVLLRGGYRRFPFLFAYAVTDFLTTVMEALPAIDYIRGIERTSNRLPDLYWRIEILMQVLVYAVVISLVYQATQHLVTRRAMRGGLVAGALLFAGISLAVHYNPSAAAAGVWMTPWTRDLSFGAAVLDLTLWAILIAQRERDPVLLMLSGGLGIQFTGDAISASIRELANQTRSHALALFGGLLAPIAFIAFLYVWWQALRTMPAGEKPQRAQIGSAHY